jgi:hypothetical protein
MQWEDFICVGCKEEIFSYLTANKKYRLLLNKPLLITFIFVYKVMIAILYQKVPSDSKFNLLLEQSSSDQDFSN